MSRTSRPSLAGRVVAITGGAQGIGRATATALAHRGCRVAIGDIDAAAAARTADEIGAGCISFGLDVTDRGSFEDFVAQVEEHLGPIDVIVNNAGVMILGPFESESDDAMRRMVEINLVGVIYGTRLVIPGMKARGRGHIVNIASQAGKFGFPGGATYSAVKHGVVGLSEAVLRELRGTGVKVSWVMPAVVDTPLGAGTQKVRGTPLISPDTVAEAIVEALESGRAEVWIPRRNKLLVNGAAVVPRVVGEAIARFIGAYNVLAGADHAARDRYERDAGRDRDKVV